MVNEKDSKGTAAGPKEEEAKEEIVLRNKCNIPEKLWRKSSINVPMYNSPETESESEPESEPKSEPEPDENQREGFLTDLERAVMYIDISQSEHPFIIGLGGQRVKSICLETGCYIRFPKRPLSLFNSRHWVNMSGSVAQLEQARTQLRLCSPLQMAFKLPFQLTREIHGVPFVRRVEMRYSVDVHVLQHIHLLVVKGTEYQAEDVCSAIYMMMEYVYFNTNQPVFLKMQVKQDHHSIVRGPKDCNLLAVCRYSKAEIDFDQPHVIIRGTIDQVYIARQLLIGLLPVTLSFSFTTKEQIKPGQLMDMNIKYGIHVEMQRNGRRHHVVITGHEKFVNNMYEARREFLHVWDKPTTCYLPDTYFLPGEKKSSTSGQRLRRAAQLAGFDDSSKFLRSYNLQLCWLCGHAFGIQRMHNIDLSRWTMPAGRQNLTQRQDLFTLLMSLNLALYIYILKPMGIDVAKLTEYFQLHLIRVGISVAFDHRRLSGAIERIRSHTSSEDS